MKFAFSVIVEQVLGLGPDEPVTDRILHDYQTFMKGLVSFPLHPWNAICQGCEGN